MTISGMAIAALLSSLAFTGLFGLYAQAYSWLIALVTAFVLTPLIALVTKGKYYIARQNVHFACSDELATCSICDQHYAQTDFAYCPFYDAPICSLCCTLDANCKDQCKPMHTPLHQQAALHLIGAVFKQEISNQTSVRITRFVLIAGGMLGIVGLIFWLFYLITRDQLSPQVVEALSANLSNLFFVLAVLVCILAWWIVLGYESRELAETELQEQNERLDAEITERKAVTQELNNRTAELALHNQILQLIGQGSKLPVIFDRFAYQVETLHPGMLCSILLLDEDGKHLRHGSAPSLPDFYNHAIDGLAIGDGVGSCGTAAFRGERIIVEDVQQHPYWTPFRDLARQAGVQACWSQPFKNSKGEVLGTFAIYRRQAARPSNAEIDLVEHYANLAVLAIERKQAEQNLLLAATAFESQEGMFITDANSMILRVNQAFTNITGYAAEEAIGKNPHFLQSGCQNPDFYAAMWKSINNTGAWEGDIRNRRKNGEIYPEHLTITAVKDTDGILTNYVATLTDITVSKAAEEEINNLAFYDPLTGLPNRRLLLDRLKPALASSHRSARLGALLFIDMDNFKTLNDTLGHDMGDLLLQQVAERLTSCVRESDTVARLGGDEFVVMLEDLSDQTIEATAETEVIGNKILTTLNQPYQLVSHDYHSTPSIGVTLFNGHKQSIDELLKQADIAMYQAKAAGRNTLRFFDQSMQTVISARAGLENDLRLGLQEKQFLLHYQPQIDDEGRITSAEALVRWQHPQHGLIHPLEFIRLAEETGLILPLGLWVLETACAQLVAWAAQKETAHLVLAVNVSARQLYHPDFVDQVLAVLDHTGADPHKLKLELTESLLVSNIEDIIAKMTALKAKGVEFSLDDFGTGYSSLSYLKRLPLNQLKIDQGFVRDILTDPNDAAIAKMIVALAENMGLEVIAEGVENDAQRDLLARQGCHDYQGYLFSHPLPLEAFEEFVKRVSHTSEGG